MLSLIFMARGKCYKTFFTFIKKFLFDLLDYLTLANIKILVEYCGKAGTYLSVAS
jgi:hypothetical protein